MEKERKRKKKMAGIYDIKEDDRENKSGDESSDIDEEKKSDEDEEESQAVIPYVPIL